MSLATFVSSCSSHHALTLPTTTLPKTAQLCPLTGLSAPDGQIPQRPALAVKVDNYISARPQTGLNQADIVFEEPVEGGITRFVAVYQCQNSKLIGPVRSARAVDVGILTELSNPIFVHVGGIQPVINLLTTTPIHNVGLADYQNLVIKNTARVSPYATYINAKSVWSTFSSEKTIPRPLFNYSTMAPSNAQPTSEIHLDYSGNSDIYWQWSQGAQKWLRFYVENNQIVPALDSSGQQISATNIVVEAVNVTYGPYYENPGSPEVQSQMTGTGNAFVFTDGQQIPGTWTRPNLQSSTVFLNTQNQPVTLFPGNTWVEIYPNKLTVSTNQSQTFQPSTTVK